MLKNTDFSGSGIKYFWNFCCWNQNSDHLQDKSAIECTFTLYRKAMSGLKMPEI